MNWLCDKIFISLIVLVVIDIYFIVKEANVKKTTWFATLLLLALYVVLLLIGGIFNIDTTTPITLSGIIIICITSFIGVTVVKIIDCE